MPTARIDDNRQATIKALENVLAIFRFDRYEPACRKSLSV